MDMSNQPSISEQSAAIKRPTGHLSLAFIKDREACWTAIKNRNVFVSCGDDRSPTEASAEALMAGKGELTMNPLDGYASVYGGVAGLAKNVLVIGAAQFGSDFIKAVNGFDGIMKLLTLHSNNLQTLHSAEGNEQNPEHFSDTAETPIGCAYAAGVGATATLLVGSSSAIRDVAKADQQFVFGNAAGFDDLLRGQQAFLDHATNKQGGDFAVDRKHYKQYKVQFGDRLDIMILAGSHTSAKTSGVISSFSLTHVGSSVKAHQQGVDFYRLDIGIAADTVLQALTRPLAAINIAYTLSPELLMRAFQLDSTPVRAVLASQDKDPELNGTLNALNLQMGTRDNPFESLQTLRERQTNGYYTK
jgi:hypothetical protein